MLASLQVTDCLLTVPLVCVGVRNPLHPLEGGAATEIVIDALELSVSVKFNNIHDMLSDE